MRWTTVLACAAALDVATVVGADDDKNARILRIFTYNVCHEASSNPPKSKAWYALQRFREGEHAVDNTAEIFAEHLRMGYDLVAVQEDTLVGNGSLYTDHPRIQAFRCEHCDHEPCYDRIVSPVLGKYPAATSTLWNTRTLDLLAAGSSHLDGERAHRPFQVLLFESAVLKAKGKARTQVLFINAHFPHPSWKVFVPFGPTMVDDTAKQAVHFETENIGRLLTAHKGWKRVIQDQRTKTPPPHALLDNLVSRNFTFNPDALGLVVLAGDLNRPVYDDEISVVGKNMRGPFVRPPKTYIGFGNPAAADPVALGDSRRNERTAHGPDQVLMWRAEEPYRSYPRERSTVQVVWPPKSRVSSDHLALRAELLL